MMKTVHLFFAYQFSSIQISRMEREMSVARSVQYINAELRRSKPNVEIKWTFCDLQAGIGIFNQITKSIEDCCIFIADVSEINPNVMFELGMAYAFTRKIHKSISILCHESIDIKRLPSDMAGIFIEIYKTEYFQQIFSGQLSRCINEFLEHQNEFNKAQVSDYSFLGLKDKEVVDIVCSELPEKELPYFALETDRNYLRYARFADLDSFIHLKTHLIRMYPQLKIRDFTASEHKISDYETLFVLGGPAWNKRFRAFQDQLPFYFIEKPDCEDDLLKFKDEYGISAPPLGPVANENGKIHKDVSVLCKLSDVSGRKVFLFAGCLTFGVLGACKAIFCKESGNKNSNFLQEIVGENDFVSVFYSTYLEHDVNSPLFCEHPPLALFSRKMNSGAIFELISSTMK
ncbi:hypothetical protein V8J88_07485 [Massilia sp. W12]|uniref:hypothetical protein n=1 Tax=Massilia sp. W12 TaxID=3126507 RepID=UPI0030D1DFE4